MEERETNQLNDEQKWLDFYSTSISGFAEFGEKLYRELFELEEFKAVNILAGVNYFKNFIEIIDAISVNIGSSITTAPTRILIRSATEYFFSLMYLFEDKESIERKSLSISYCSIIEEMRGYEPFFPENLRETERRLKLEFKDAQNIDLSSFDYTSKAKYFKELLGHSDFREIHQEYIKTSNSTFFKNKKYIPWYSLSAGPTNVKNLALKTDMINIYESIYNEFSHYTHGSKSFQTDFIHQGQDGSLHMYQKRTPYNLKFVSSPSISLCYILFGKFIKVFKNDDEKLFSELDSLVKNYKKTDPESEPIDINKGLVLKFPNF